LPTATVLPLSTLTSLRPTAEVMLPRRPPLPALPKKPPAWAEGVMARAATRESAMIGFISDTPVERVLRRHVNRGHRGSGKDNRTGRFHALHAQDARKYGKCPMAERGKSAPGHEKTPGRKAGRDDKDRVLIGCSSHRPRNRPG